MTGITVRGTGSYLPERIVENAEFSAFLDTSDEWIRSHTGIVRRRIAVDEPAWYMAAEAAKKAIEAAGIDPDEIDMIIGTTVTQDYSYPSMACLVQDAVSAKNAFCFDIAAACAGFTYALDMARRYIATGDVKTALIVSAELLTQYADFTDRASCVLFGDGAGACVVSAGTGRFASSLSSDGSGARHLYAKPPRKQTPFSADTPVREFGDFTAIDNGYTVMDGHEVYRFATRAMPKAVRDACSKLDIAPDALDLLIPHQANLRIIQAAMKQLRLPMERAYVNIHDYANTSSATCAICLDECVRHGRLSSGDSVCLVGFGSGLVCGAVVFDYNNREE